MQVIFNHFELKSKSFISQYIIAITIFLMYLYLAFPDILCNKHIFLQNSANVSITVEYYMHYLRSYYDKIYC